MLETAACGRGRKLRGGGGKKFLSGCKRERERARDAPVLQSREICRGIEERLIALLNHKRFHVFSLLGLQDLLCLCAT
jgi:hypothetical protein